ncbi:MAG: hypothetical protein ABI384_10795 [Allobranchiibius sp.]
MQGPPPYWRQRTDSAFQPDGRKIALTVWGWSWTSEEDAESIAAERLTTAFANLHAGAERENYYPRLPLREEILREVSSTSGQLLAVVTRNRYGAEVLSTQAVVIADVDLPAQRRSRGRLRRIFGSGAEDPALSPEALALQRIAAYADRSPQRGTHVYRTAAGLRVIITGEQVDPSSPAATDILEQLGTDPVYLRLCAAHGTYRARLTPKPWRLRPPQQAPTVRWPYGSAEARRRADAWLKDYSAGSADYAVCAKIASHGAPATGDQEVVLRLHEDATRVWQSQLPLA